LVLASDLINEQLALLAGLPEEQMGLGHAFEMDPMLENGFLYELAQAQMTREIFPKAPLKYMPPTNRRHRKDRARHGRHPASHATPGRSFRRNSPASSSACSRKCRPRNSEAA
jgi:hypothetical protein